MQPVDFLTVKARHDREQVMQAVDQSLAAMDEFFSRIRRTLGAAGAVQAGGVGTNGRKQRVA